MKKEVNENLMCVRMSELYLLKGNLAEADDMFQLSHQIKYDELDQEDKIHFLKVLWTWCRIINSEQSREIVRGFNINLKNISELHYYILILRKKIMYPLLLITWFFKRG